MRCGPCLSRCCPSTSLPIALEEDARVCQIGAVPMRSFTCFRTGCQWQALDQTEWCAHSTAHGRFQAWGEAGVFFNLWKAGVEQFDDLCGIAWDWLAMDGAMTKAPLGGEKNGAQSHRPGQVRRQA